MPSDFFPVGILQQFLAQTGLAEGNDDHKSFIFKCAYQ